MDNPKCPSCGGKMKRNGYTKAGTPRLRCTACGASDTHGRKRIDNSAKRLREFLAWLLSGKVMAQMPGGGRTFRRRTSEFWSLWPMPPLVDEVHRVVYVDGIYVRRGLCVLIACTDEHVVGWYLARGESTRAWRALLSRIAPPDMVVTDGGQGFAAACAEEWPATRVQRCVFHAFEQVKRQTTTRPNLECGAELYGIAKDLLAARDADAAAAWVASYAGWCSRWDGFLKQKSLVEGRSEYTHRRLRRARSGLNRLIKAGTLFTFLDPELAAAGPLPATNNMVEGGVNAQIRHMLMDHRGLSTMRRVKAVFWWCYMHCEYRAEPAKMLREMPTDAQIDGLFREAGRVRDDDGRPSWGDRAVWEEFHMSGEWRSLE